MPGAKGKKTGGTILLYPLANTPSLPQTHRHRHGWHNDASTAQVSAQCLSTRTKSRQDEFSPNKVTPRLVQPAQSHAKTSSTRTKSGQDEFNPHKVTPRRVQAEQSHAKTSSTRTKSRQDEFNPHKATPRRVQPAQSHAKTSSTRTKSRQDEFKHLPYQFQNTDESPNHDF